MFEIIILLTLTVLVAYGGVRRKRVRYLGLTLDDYQTLIPTATQDTADLAG